MKRNCIYLFVIFAATLCAPSAWAQSGRSDLVGMREDLNILSRQMSRIQLEMEELRRHNEELSRELRSRDAKIQQITASVNAVSETTRAQLQTLEKDLQTTNQQTRKEIIAEVTRQIEALAAQTQKAFDELAGSIGGVAALTPAVTFSDDYPRNGVTYEVKRGDTLSGIARMHNSTIRDIQNANRIANPKELKVGQVIFVPQRN